MAKVRSTPGKFSTRASQAAGDYQAGVQNPRVSWQQATNAAAASQAAGAQQAIAEKRFEKGVAKAGDAKWSSKASTIGASRYPQGVQEAQVAYDQGFAPFAQVIESTTLPPRFPKGDPRNIQRVAAIASALRNKKIKG